MAETEPTPTPAAEYAATTETRVTVVPGYGFITPEGTLVNAAQMLYAYPATNPTASHGARLFFPVANVNPGEDCRSELDTAATVQEIAAALAPAPVVTGEEITTMLNCTELLYAQTINGLTPSEAIACKERLQRFLINLEASHAR